MTRATSNPLLRICLVAQQFPVSGRLGGPAHLRAIASGLAARGHQVIVLTGHDPYGRQTMNLDGAQVFFLLEGRSPRVRRDYFMTLVKSKFLDLHSQTPFHLVHSFDESALLIGRSRSSLKVATAFDSAATRMGEIFSILGFEQETASSVLRTLISIGFRFLQTYFDHDRSILKSADAVFVSGPRERVALERYYLYPDARIFSIPYGVDYTEQKVLSANERENEVASLKKSLGFPSDAKVAITHSDFRTMGELMSVLEAFDRIAIRRQNVRLIILGSGPKQKAIEYETLMLALGGRVVFAGDVKPSEISLYVSLGDVFINLSARISGVEPSFIEAMAQGKVVIASELGPLANVIEHSVDGYLVRPADISEITSLLDTYLGSEGSPENIHLPIREAARKKISSVFNPTKMVEETLNAYWSIVDDTKKRLIAFKSPPPQPSQKPSSPDISLGAP